MECNCSWRYCRKVQGGDTVKFQAGDNLEVKQDKTTFTYSLAKDLKGLNSVTVGDENGASTKITPAGTTVKMQLVTLQQLTVQV